MTYRFEEEDYQNTYVLEDYYCTNPFCDCDHVTVSFCDKETYGNRFTFLLNFNKTHASLPNQPKLTKVQSDIVKGFVKELPDELLLLFKQRYMEAKAYGEKQPKSYLLFESGRYANYCEFFPRNQKTLDFSYEDDKYFAEDAYEMDPRNDNRDIKLTFYQLKLDNEKQSPLLSYTYYLNEQLREEEDARLEQKHNDMVLALNAAIPDLYDILKTRYKEIKKIGEELLQEGPKNVFSASKINPNDACPCGSGKKYKKCCVQKLN